MHNNAHFYLLGIQAMFAKREMETGPPETFNKYLWPKISR